MLVNYDAPPCLSSGSQGGIILQEIPHSLNSKTQGKRNQDLDHGQTDHRNTHDKKL